MPEAVQSSLLSPQVLAQLERLELVSRKVFRGRMKGERRSKRKGQSVEFADFRNYVPGDDLRFIDWNTYARLEKLFLKMFMEEEDLHFYALIDASRSMEGSAGWYEGSDFLPSGGPANTAASGSSYT